MEREKIKLTVSELELIVYDESDAFKIIESNTVGTWRHGTEEVAIVQRADGKFFKIPYRDSVKDSCEFQDINYDGEYCEVFPRETVITVYE